MNFEHIYLTIKASGNQCKKFFIRCQEKILDTHKKLLYDSKGEKNE